MSRFKTNEQRRLKMSILLILMSVLAPCLLYAQDTLWTRTYGGTDWEDAPYTQETSDGGYIMVGSTQSSGPGSQAIYLTKLDASGNTIWTQTYGGSEWDYGRCARQTSDGGYIITGSTWSYGEGYGDFYLIKTNSSGDTVWTRTYAYTSGSYMEEAASVQQASDGGYIVVGWAEHPSSGAYNAYAVKTAANGDTVWTRYYNLGEDSWAWSVRPTADGGYIMVGGVAGGSWIYSYFALKVDSNGDVDWYNEYGGGSDEWANDVVPTSDGGYFIVGASYSTGDGDGDFLVVKTDSNGDTVWTRSYGGSGYDEAGGVTEASDGGYLIAGNSDSFGAGGNDFYIVRINSSGDTLWTRTYGGSLNEDMVDCAERTSDGGYVVSGRTYSFGAGESDGWMLRLASDTAEPVPTLSEWGMLILVLSLMAIATVTVIRKRKAIEVRIHG